jgi:hypothetical protein
MVIDRIVDSDRPEIALHCEGFYGLGAGWESVKRPDVAGLYCNACPLGKRCWEAHKDRIRSLLPAMMDRYDDVVEEAKAAGAVGSEIVDAVRAAFDGLDPLLTVMGENVEDGVRIANQMAPKFRGEFTIPWPFRTH